MLKPPDARKDFLTNCYVRDGIQPFLNLLEERFAVSKKPFSVLITDVDHFKHFNDKFGHLNGDEVLKYFSSSLRLDLEDEENAPFRFGGDEFVVIFPDKTAGEAYHLASRLKKNMKSRSCLIRGRQLTITFSGGIACYPTDAKNLEQLLERADQALYYSKNHGRAQVTCYHEVKYKTALKFLFFAAVVVLGLSALNLVQVDMTAPFKMAGEAISKFKLPSFQAGGDPKKPADSTGSSPAGNPNSAQSAADPLGAATGITPGNTGIGTSDTASPETGKVRLHLTNNRKIEGKLVEENEDEVALEIGFQEGKAMMRFKRARIKQIEKI